MDQNALVIPVKMLQACQTIHLRDSYNNLSSLRDWVRLKMGKGGKPLEHMRTITLEIPGQYSIYHLLPALFHRSTKTKLPDTTTYFRTLLLSPMLE